MCRIWQNSKDARRRHGHAQSATRGDTSPSDGSYHRCLPRRLPLISPRPRNPEEGGAAHQADSSRPLCPHLRREVRMGTDSVIDLSGARDRLREFYNTPPGGQGQTLLLSHSSGSGRQDHRSGDLGQDPRETDLLRYNRPRGFPPAETPSTGPTLQGATARVAATAKRAPSPRHQRASVALGRSPLPRPRRIDRRIWSQVGSSRARRVRDLSLGHVHSRTKSRIYQREGARGNPTGHPSDRQTEFPTRAIDLLRQHISSGLAQQGGVYEGSTSGPAHSSPDPEGGGGPEPDTPWTTHSGHHQPGSRSAVQRLLTTPFLSGVQHGICPRGVGPFQTVSTDVDVRLGCRVLWAPNSSMAAIVQKIATARVQTQTGHPRSWTSAVFLLYPEVQAPEMRLLKSWTSWKLRLSVPASSSDLAHLLHLQDRGRLRFNVMAFRTFSTESSGRTE
ncbi:GAG-polyprotein [Carpediemonas membranifera]|uniref:GAG-polyprotein n=1 Tax=Carpediemonas membranifera TaxID=201153 RepID=A0A8J6AYW7_9EUKA|nr:GAG-polyprotein [Carpediemonas membranifera]|eukprot:KAG9394815.1 GAG-polyprotein [Carpediemonas membranifera]